MGRIIKKLLAGLLITTLLLTSPGLSTYQALANTFKIKPTPPAPGIGPAAVPPNVPPAGVSETSPPLLPGAGDASISAGVSVGPGAAETTSATAVPETTEAGQLVANPGDSTPGPVSVDGETTQGDALNPATRHAAEHVAAVSGQSAVRTIISGPGSGTIAPGVSETDSALRQLNDGGSGSASASPLATADGTHAAATPGTSNGSSLNPAHPGAPHSSATPQPPSPAREITVLNGVSLTGALEGAIGDSPDSRRRFRATLAQEEISEDQRIAFWHVFAGNLQEALGREGVSQQDLQNAQGFLAQISADNTLPQAVQADASQRISSLGSFSAPESSLAGVAQNMGLSAERAGVVVAIARREPSRVRTQAQVQTAVRVVQAVAGRGIQPTSGIVLEILRETDTSPYLNIATLGMARLWRSLRALDRLSKLKKDLENREPDIFDDKETDVFFTVVSNRMDLNGAGYYGYRKRVDAGREHLRRLGHTQSPWIEQPLHLEDLKPIEIQHTYKPYDASWVDRNVIVEQRVKLAQAYANMRSLRALDDAVDQGQLTPQERDEIIRRVWAYLQMLRYDREMLPKSLEQAQRELQAAQQARHEASEGGIDAAQKKLEQAQARLDNLEKPTPDGVWKISGQRQVKYLNTYPDIHSRPLPSIDEMRAQVQAAAHDSVYDQVGHEFFYAFHVALNGLTLAYRRHKDHTKSPQYFNALHNLSALTLMGYQWTDEVARQELRQGQDNVESWDAGDVYIALNRLRLVFDKKTDEVVDRIGIPAPKEVIDKLHSERRKAKEQLGRIKESKQGELQETLTLVPAYGVTALMRGFCGRDCSKSLDSERGHPALRGLEPWSRYRIGMVNGQAVGYLQQVDALQNGRPVRLAETLQFLGREAVIPKMLQALDQAAKAQNYVGVALTSDIHPENPATKQPIANLTNFHRTVVTIQHLPAYQNGEEFQPQFSAQVRLQMDRWDALLGPFPYDTWNLAARGYPVSGNYRLLRFEETAPAASGTEATTSAAATEDDLVPVDTPWVQRMLQKYRAGQFWLVVTFGLYYALFAPTMAALFGIENVGDMRAGYALALATLGAIGGVIATFIPIFTILKTAAALRILIWAALMPLIYFLLGPIPAAIWMARGLMYLDGSIVSVNTMADIDNMGPTMAAEEYGFKLNQDETNKLNSGFESMYALTKMVLPIPMAALALYAGAALASSGISFLGGAPLLVVMALAFLVPLSMSILEYRQAERSYPPLNKTQEEIEARLRELRDLAPSDAVQVEIKTYSHRLKALQKLKETREREENNTLLQKIKEVLAKLWRGLQIATTDLQIRARLGLFSTERTRDDGMLIVLLPTVGISVLAASPYILEVLIPILPAVQDLSVIIGPLGALLTAMLVSAGASGILLGSRWQHGRKFSKDDTPKYSEYKFYFPLDFLGSMMVLLMPLVPLLISLGYFWPAMALAALSSFLFYLISVPSRLAFQNLYQTILRAKKAPEVSALGRSLLHFVSSIGLVVLSWLFGIVKNPLQFLWIASLIYAGIGLLYQLVGPLLLFTMQERGVSATRARLERIFLAGVGAAAIAGIFAGLYLWGGLLGLLAIPALIGAGAASSTVLRAYRNNLITGREAGISAARMALISSALALIHPLLALAPLTYLGLWQTTPGFSRWFLSQFKAPQAQAAPVKT